MVFCSPDCHSQRFALCVRLCICSTEKFDIFTHLRRVALADDNLAAVL